MTQGDGNRFVGTRMRCCRREIRSTEVFMEIRTADAYEGRGDLLIVNHRAGSVDEIEHIP
jgi:hypothetical protein